MPYEWDRIALRRCLRCANDDVGEDIWIRIDDRLACRRCAAAALRGERGVLAATAAYRGRLPAARPIIAYKERHDGWQDTEAMLASALHEAVLDLVKMYNLPMDTLIAPVPSYGNRRPHVRRLTAHLPNVVDVLKKVRDIRQTGCSRRTRHEQSHGAYRVRWGARVRGRIVIVTDDVLTTGATLNACADALSAAGAEAVYGATILRMVSAPLPRPVTCDTGQITVRFTATDAQGRIPYKGGDTGRVWVRFGCGPGCPHIVTAGPLRTPTPHIDVQTSWLCTCHVRHEIQLARLGGTLRVTVPPRSPPELLVAVQIPPS
jgi:predicted amidophosphoribosyltransferase